MPGSQRMAPGWLCTSMFKSTTLRHALSALDRLNAQASDGWKKAVNVCQSTRAKQMTDLAPAGRCSLAQQQQEVAFETQHLKENQPLVQSTHGQLAIKFVAI